jgi:hypothetical protein
MNEWALSMKAKDDGECTVSWTLLFRASLFGYEARAFHQACDKEGSCVVVVRVENGRIAVAYNEDGFVRTDLAECTPDQNGFIVSINEAGSCGAQFDRTEHVLGIYNHPRLGPVFNSDLLIRDNCNVNMGSWSEMGEAYGEGADRFTLFGQEFFRVLDYEVFKIVIE